MADVRRFDLEELTNRPGTYYNPTTEVLLDVDDHLAARGAARVARLEHLADVGLALVARLGAGDPRGGAAARLAVLADRQRAAPDLVVEAAAREQRDHRDDGGDPDHHEDHDPEGLLHPSGLSPMWRRLRRRTMAPRRPVLFEDQWALGLVTAIVLLGSLAFVAWLFLG